MALTPVQTLYDAFLALIESDEWDFWDDTSTSADLAQLARAAKTWFKFPRTSLDWDAQEAYFIDEKISNDEIQVLANFMKMIWYSRSIDTWENIKTYYTERDFSPAKQLSEFRQRNDSQLKTAKELEARYYRSINNKPYDYTKFAGG